MAEWRQSSRNDRPIDDPRTSGDGIEDPGDEAAVSPGTILYLRRTRPWVRFFSVLCFIGVALWLLVGLGSSAITGDRTSGLEMALSLLFAFLFLIPGVHLARYGSRIGRLTREPGVEHLERALEAQKSFWRFLSIVCVTFVGLYVLAIAGGIVFGILAG